MCANLSISYPARPWREQQTLVIETDQCLSEICWYRREINVK